MACCGAGRRRWRRFRRTRRRPKGKLVLYTSQPERDATQTTTAFKQAYPGVEVEVFRSGTTEVMGKLAAEFSAGAAEGRRAADRRRGQHGSAEEGRPAACLSRKRRSPGSAAGTYDADSTYFGSKLITTGIAVNTAAKSAAGVLGRSREARIQGPDRDAEPALFGRRGDHARHDDRASRSRLELSSRSSRPTRPSRCAATARC